MTNKQDELLPEGIFDDAKAAEMPGSVTYECVEKFARLQRERNTRPTLSDTPSNEGEAVLVYQYRYRGHSTWVDCSKEDYEKYAGYAECETRIVYTSPPSQTVDIGKLVDRFLGWKLPKSFSPDVGISFSPPQNPEWWPIGTNLLDAEQARQMFEYVLEGATSSQAVREQALREAAEICHQVGSQHLEINEWRNAASNCRDSILAIIPKEKNHGGS